MIRSLMQQIARVAVLATLAVTVAEAQSGAGSDFTGPGGGGAGLGGSVAPLGVPSGAASGPLSADGVAGLKGVKDLFSNPGAGGLSIPDPAGGSAVTLSPEHARAIAAVLSGGGADAAQALTAILGGGAGPLVSALASLGGNQSRSTLSGAISAYNGVIEGGSGAPSPALLAIRYALSVASR